MNAHFCFSELLILMEKRFADFLLGHLSTINQFFKKYRKKPTQESCTKKVQHQAPQITLFLTHPVLTWEAENPASQVKYKVK